MAFLQLFAAALALSLCARVVYLRTLTAGYAPLRYERSGWIRKVTLRKPELVSRIDGSGETRLPEPRETRVLVYSLAGIPLGRKWAAIPLPHSVQDHLGQTRAEDFDARFASAFRLAP